MSESQQGNARQQILLVAKQLFARQGYRGLSMREIAEAVGVSKAALYYHFKDKEQLLLAILDAYLDELETIIDGVCLECTDCRTQIQSFVEEILSQPVEQRSVIRLSSQEFTQLSDPARQAFYLSYHKKFIDKITAMIVRGMQKGEIRPMEPALVVWALLGIMYPYFYPSHVAEVMPTREVAQQISRIFWQGVANP